MITNEMAEILEDQYNSVFSTPTTNTATTYNDQEETTKTLSEIPHTMIKKKQPKHCQKSQLQLNCAEHLVLPLSIIWKGSLQKSSIPTKLKFNIIPPIHKGGSKSLPANYRPVASHIIKVFEKITRNRLAAFLEQTT